MFGFEGWGFGSRWSDEDLRVEGYEGGDVEQG